MVGAAQRGGLGRLRPIQRMGHSHVIPKTSAIAPLLVALHAYPCGARPPADLWHLACALFVEPQPLELVFLTLDKRQRAAARVLGFPTS